MKRMSCLICAGTDFKKVGEAFICNGCGSSYNIDEAKKLLTEDADNPDAVTSFAETPVYNPVNAKTSRTLTFIRKNAMICILYKTKIYKDGREIIILRNGETKQCTVDTGSFDFTVKTDGVRDATFHVGEGVNDLVFEVSIKREVFGASMVITPKF